MKTQIWIAISVYVLVAIIKKELEIELSLGEILQILSIVLFEKVPIYASTYEKQVAKQEFPISYPIVIIRLIMGQC